MQRMLTLVLCLGLLAAGAFAQVTTAAISGTVTDKSGAVVPGVEVTAVCVYTNLTRTAVTDDANHIRDLIEQVLFTSPGERVMRPDFGSGVLALVFEPNSTALAATTQVLVQGALQQHLSHLIAVQSVEVEAVDATLRIDVRYTVLRDGSVRQERFFAPGGTP